MLIKVAAWSKSKENANVYMLKLIYKNATENFQIQNTVLGIAANIKC